MKPNEQKKLVTDIVHNVVHNLIDAIDDGRVPASWKGPEFRRWLADRFRRNTIEMPIERERAYLQESLDNNV